MQSALLSHCDPLFWQNRIAVNQLFRKILSSTLNQPQGAYIIPMFCQVKRIAVSYFRQFADAIPVARRKCVLTDLGTNHARYVQYACTRS